MCVPFIVILPGLLGLAVLPEHLMPESQALATGGNFYELRDWSDADWTKARDSIKAQNEKDRAARG